VQLALHRAIDAQDVAAAGDEGLRREEVEAGRVEVREGTTAFAASRRSRRASRLASRSSTRNRASGSTTVSPSVLSGATSSAVRRTAAARTRASAVT
jgi:hypothetical protein